jgi:hypothetical protein
MKKKKEMKKNLCQLGLTCQPHKKESGEKKQKD